MKKKFLVKMALVLALIGTMIISPNMAVMASTNTETPTIARTKAWDGIQYTLGGVPESVKKIEYSGSIFYLNNNVSEQDFIAVIEAGAEAVNLKPPQENGKLYQYPIYILWNKDKTVLLVHPIIWKDDEVLEAVAIPTAAPASLTGETPVRDISKMTEEEQIEYMLSSEYVEAVRTEFYRLLNEHRVANGVRELEVNKELEKYADIRANEQRTRFGHTRPNGSAAGSGWHNSRNAMNTRYAENVLRVGAIGADPKNTAQGIFNIWKESAGHNRHMIYNFDSNITMAFGIVPKLDDNGFVTTGAVFATGY